MQIHLLKRAEADLENIFDYIAKENIAAAFTILDLIKKRIAQLLDYPHLGRIGTVENTRELIVAGTSYIIVYRIEKERIYILSVMHGAQHWPNAF